ncbi:MAG: acetyl-coenzyme A synthetase N-terminal domain-containing protein, partial [Pseudoalteromonas sp.]
MSQSIYPVPANIKNAALVDNDKYNTLYKQSIDDPEGFWSEHGKRLDWSTPYTKVKNTSFDKGHISIKWYEDGELNASYNCIDRHLATKADKTALIWEGDNPEHCEHISYQKLHDEVAKFANGLKKLGVKKGDRIAIYMPMSPQAVYAMQACARLGAIHSVVFGG